MILIKNYNKPNNCYNCPGYNKEYYYCKFDSSIDFDKYPIDPVPPTCPMIDISPKQLHMGEWIQIDDSYPLTYDCSNCTTMVKRKTLYCPRCGNFMINGEVK